MSKLYLSFTGICLFIPRFHLDDLQHQGRNEVRVLLGDSREHPPVPHDPMRHPHERHLPRLVCPIEHVLHGPGRRSEDRRFVHEGRTWAVFFLDDQDLFLGSPRQSLQIELGGGTQCPTSADHCSFLWAGPLEKISQRLARAKPACFRRLRPHISVEARVALTQGCLHAFEIASEDDYPFLFEFKVPGAGQPEPHRQALADSVICEVDFNSTILELKTRLIRNARQTDVQRIYPQGVGSELTIALRAIGERVNASVKNMPGPDIDGSRGPLPRPEVDIHFAHVYQMSDAFNGHEGANVPHLLDVCSETIQPCVGSLKFLDKDLKFLHRGNPNCPPPSGMAYDEAADWIFDLPPKE